MPVLRLAEGPFLIVGWDEVIDWLLTRGLRITLIAGLLAAAYLAFRLAFPRIVRGAIFRGIKEPDEEVRKRADTLVSVGLRTAILAAFLADVITILHEAGVNITAIVAGLGITGLTLALGSQALVRDALTGLFILAEDQYRQGDTVEVAGVWGVVEDLSLRRTLVRDMDGVLHTIPNSSIGVASNHTRGYGQVNLDVRVAYGEDLGRVAAIIDQVGRELAADPSYRRKVKEAPRVASIEEVGDTGVRLKVLGITRPGQQWEIASELRRRLIAAFLAEGVRVPFPPHVVASRA